MQKIKIFRSSQRLEAVLGSDLLLMYLIIVYDRWEFLTFRRFFEGVYIFWYGFGEPHYSYAKSRYNSFKELKFIEISMENAFAGIIQLTSVIWVTLLNSPLSRCESFE